MHRGCVRMCVRSAAEYTVSVRYECALELVLRHHVGELILCIDVYYAD